MTNREEKKELVLAFGVFDGLHPGHISFLEQARLLGGRLVAVVARDEVVLRLKKHSPQQRLIERMEALTGSGLVDEVVRGDLQEGSWTIFDKHKPDIIALGYDQHELKKNLTLVLPRVSFSCRVVMLEPYKPAHYHSSKKSSRV